MGTINRIEVYSTEDMHRLCESGRSAFMSDATYLSGQATAIRRRVALALREEGLDGPRAQMLGVSFGSSAEAAAKAIERPLKLAADHLETAAKYMKAAELAWNKYFKVPMEVSMRAREKGRSSQAARI